jgi:hypothetical protein
MEAGKQRLSRDTARDATRQEIDDLKRESADLKVPVAQAPAMIHSNTIGGPGAEVWRRRTMVQPGSVDAPAINGGE